MVDLDDFVFHSQRNLNIFMSQKVVDLVDLGFPLIKAQKSKYVHVPKRG